MSPALANFLFEAANFLLLAAVLGWVLFKPVRGALDRERERHTRELEEGERVRAEAESLLAEAREARAAADREKADEHGRILAAARQEAARILEAARTAAAAERHTLAEDLAAARNREAAALAETVGRIAAGSVSQLLDALGGPSLDSALVRAACEELRKLPGTERSPALVETARPLDTEARKLLGDLLGEGFEERTVGELRAGVRVTTPAGQVDATAGSFARQAARAVIAAGAGGGDG